MHPQPRQQDVAERLGVHHVELSRWEGDKHLPNAERLAELAAIYGVSVIWLLRGEGPVAINKDVPRGTVSESLSSPYAEVSAAAAKRIRDFEREAARLGATDQELDHIGESLRSGSSRSFYMGGKEEEELEHLIAGLRAWLDRRISDRKAAERRKR